VDGSNQHQADQKAAEQPARKGAADRLQLLMAVVGADQVDQFRRVRPGLAEHGRVLHFPTAETALEWLAHHELAFDLIVLLQQYPGQFRAAAIDRFHAACPLARVILVLGSWCEGEMRTGQPLPGVIRVYWHQWEAACGSELVRLTRAEDSTWALPATATDEDRFLLLGDRRLPQGEGLVAILADRWPVYRYLADTCTRCGFEPFWCREHRHAAPSSAALAVVDVHGAEHPSPAQVHKWLRPLGGVPAVGLFDFPRPHHLRRYRAAGIVAALSKPLVIDELAAELVRLGGTAAARR